MKHDELLHGAPTTFTDFAMTLCSQLDDAKVIETVTVLLDGIEVDGEAINVDEYFAANYGEMVEVLELSIRENFESFFTAKGIKDRLLGTIQNLIPQPPTSEE